MMSMHDAIDTAAVTLAIAIGIWLDWREQERLIAKMDAREEAWNLKERLRQTVERSITKVGTTP